MTGKLTIATEIRQTCGLEKKHWTAWARQSGVTTRQTEIFWRRCAIGVPGKAKRLLTVEVIDQDMGGPPGTFSVYGDRPVGQVKPSCSAKHRYEVVTWNAWLETAVSAGIWPREIYRVWKAESQPTLLPDKGRMIHAPMALELLESLSEDAAPPAEVIDKPTWTQLSRVVRDPEFTHRVWSQYAFSSGYSKRKYIGRERAFTLVNQEIASHGLPFRVAWRLHSRWGLRYSFGDVSEAALDELGEVGGRNRYGNEISAVELHFEKTHSAYIPDCQRPIAGLTTQGRVAVTWDSENWHRGLVITCSGRVTECGLCPTAIFDTEEPQCYGTMDLSDPACRACRSSDSCAYWL